MDPSYKRMKERLITVQSQPNVQRNYKEVPDIFLDYLISQSTKGGIELPVSRGDIIDIHDEARFFIKKCYPEGPTQEKAIRYWNANKHESIWGIPIKISRFFWM